LDTSSWPPLEGRIWSRSFCSGSASAFSRVLRCGRVMAVGGCGATGARAGRRGAAHRLSFLRSTPERLCD
jgi:hypothetical protein